MVKFPLFVLKLVLTGAALMSDVRAADLSCNFTSESLQARDRYIHVQTELARKLITDSEKAIKELMDRSSAMSRTSVIGDIINGVISVASYVVPGVGPVVSLIKNFATETGLPFIEKILKSKPKASATGNANPGLIVLIEGKKIYARDPAEALVWIETRLEELEKLALARGNQLVDEKIGFLNEVCTQDNECPADSAELDELYASLAKWYEKANSTLANAGEQKQLNEMHLPFVKDTVRLLKLKQQYFDQLKTELHDRANRVCGLAAA